LLVISGILFIGFNLFWIAHFGLRHSARAIRIICSQNGFLIGMLAALAFFLWLAHKNRDEQNRSGDVEAPEAPTGSERRSDQA
jgi:hypothetical protein